MPWNGETMAIERAPDPERAKRRAEIQRGLMVDLLNMQSEADDLEKRLVAWKKRRLRAYLQLDDEMDGEPTP